MLQAEGCSLSLFHIQGDRLVSCLWNGKAGRGQRKPGPGTKLAHRERHGLGGGWQRVGRQTGPKNMAKTVNKSYTSQPGALDITWSPEKVEESGSGREEGCVWTGKCQGWSPSSGKSGYLWLGPVTEQRSGRVPAEGSLAGTELGNPGVPIRATPWSIGARGRGS